VDEAGTYIEGEVPRRPGRDSTATAAGAADRGTAHHLFIELLDLARPCDLTDLRSQADGLMATGRMTVEQLSLLDFASLAQFWSSSLGSALRKHRDQVRREWAFTAGFSVGELRKIGIPVELGVPDDERIIVQGVIDLAWVGKKGIQVLDFKTDQVQPDQVAVKGGKYRPQLALYALALERILGGTVTERWLHFLTPQITLRLE
jgi:ATP-dependent helicase/nuclease subunit A